MQPTPEFVTRCWRRHELRRETDIPTVTVFAGSDDVSSAWVDALARQERLARFRVTAANCTELALHWLQQAERTCALQEHALGKIAHANQEPEAELRAGWRARSTQEKLLWLERQRERTVRADASGALSWLSGLVAPPAPEKLEPVTDLALLAAWLPRTLWPVPCMMCPSERSLAAAAQLSSRIPSLSIIAVVDGIAWQQFGSEFAPRYMTLLAEGVVAQDAAAADVTDQLYRGADSQLRHAHTEALKAHEQLVAQQPAVERELEVRARSNAELLLFRLLQAHPLTRGLFALNVRTPFMFGSRPAELDLACMQLQIAVEVDGYYHFTDDEAYRRDRRKDLLLQMEGFVVVRHLASDVIANGDAVVRQIAQLTDHRRRCGHRRAV